MLVSPKKRKRPTEEIHEEDTLPEFSAMKRLKISSVWEYVRPSATTFFSSHFASANSFLCVFDLQ